MKEIRYIQCAHLCLFVLYVVHLYYTCSLHCNCECNIHHRLQDERERQAHLRGSPKIDPEVAATTVQKVSHVQHTVYMNV